MCKPEGKRSLGSPRRRCEDSNQLVLYFGTNISNDPQISHYEAYIHTYLLTYSIQQSPS